MGNWQPIETAPKDGTEILLWGVGTATIPLMGEWMRWHDNLDGQDKQGWREVGSYDVLYGATHWMPLPAPPETNP